MKFIEYGTLSIVSHRRYINHNISPSNGFGPFAGAKYSSKRFKFPGPVINFPVFSGKCQLSRLFSKLSDMEFPCFPLTGGNPVWAYENTVRHNG